MRIFIFLFFFFSNFTNAYAIVTKDDHQKEIIESFIKKLINGQEKEAINTIFSRLNFLKSRKQEIDLAILNAESSFDQLGKAHGFEFARVEKLSPNVYRYIYQIFYDSQPIHVSIFLHKVENEWFVIKFDFSSHLKSLSPISNSNHKVSSKAKVLVEDIMSGYIKQNFTDNLSNSPINCNIFTASFINSHNKKFNYLIELFGKPTGYDLVSSERISSKNNRFIYFLNLETYPVTIVFDMYLKPNGNWCAINYDFNDQFNSMEAATPQ